VATIAFGVGVEEDEDEVFAFVCDPERRASCEAGVEEVERLSDGPVGVGSRFRVRRRVTATDLELVTEIVSLDPEERFVEERVVDGKLTGTAIRWSVRVTGRATKIRIAWTTTYRGSALFGRLVDRQLRRDLSATCRNLERALRRPDV
jgi:carbon monoxide dehydrogenase subunit G